MSRLIYVAPSGHHGRHGSRYRVRMHDTTDGLEESRELATLLRERRAIMQLTQQEVADRAGISRQTYNKYESGKTPNPKPGELRAVCRALELDPREIPVALGFVTREEIGLPPQEPPLPRSLVRVVSLLRAEQVPQQHKDQLLKIIDTALDFWYQQLGIRDIREPSAEERAKGKPVAPKR